MQTKTIFTVPILRPILRFLSVWGLRLSGWKLVGGPPPELNKMVIIAAPHTSNWDFPLMLACVFKMRLAGNWMGKDSLFPPVFGPVMRWLGGISIDRSKANNMVDQMVEQFAMRDKLCLIMTPEGTRGQVREWKSGFYRIALAAGVPIVFAADDSVSKTVKCDRVFWPTGDYEKDIIEIRSYFAGCVGIKADRT